MRLWCTSSLKVGRKACQKRFRGMERTAKHKLMLGTHGRIGLNTEGHRWSQRDTEGHRNGHRGTTMDTEGQRSAKMGTVVRGAERHICGTYEARKDT